MKMFRIFTICITIFVCFTPPIINANEYVLSWKKPDDERVVGYNIYWGIGGLENKISAGNNLYIYLSAMDLKIGEISFAAKSCDGNDNESVDFSEIITWENNLYGNGLSRVDSMYYLGEYEDDDFDGDGVSNKDDPDIDGDGIPNIEELFVDTDNDGQINPFDDDSDGDGILDEADLAPLFDHNLRYRKHLFTQEDENTVFVGLTIYETSKFPVCKTLNLTTGDQRNIIFFYNTYTPIDLENLGNLDGLNGEEIKVTVEDEEGMINTVTRDIITGEIYNPSYRNISADKHLFFYHQGFLRLAILGYCQTSQRTIVRIIDFDNMTIVCDIEVLTIGEQALDFGIYQDVNSDNLPDVAISRALSGSETEFYSITDQQKIVFN